jgi:hypothetical protein
MVGKCVGNCPRRIEQDVMRMRQQLFAEVESWRGLAAFESVKAGRLQGWTSISDNKLASRAVVDRYTKEYVWNARSSEISYKSLEKRRLDPTNQFWRKKRREESHLYTYIPLRARCCATHLCWHRDLVLYGRCCYGNEAMPVQYWDDNVTLVLQPMRPSTV